MARVQRPSIQTDIGTKTVDLGKPFPGIVATFAEAHEGAEPELVDVAPMRLNVIADRRRHEDAALEAKLAKRVSDQLVSSDPSPTRF